MKENRAVVGVVFFTIAFCFGSAQAESNDLVGTNKSPQVKTRPVDFNADIKPIFDEHCIKCHGEKKQKSDLRLDSRANILKGGDLGEPAASPGHPEKSTIIEFISLDPDDDEIMPPKGDPLTKEQISLISKWIKEGAKMPEAKITKAEALWSHKPIIKPAVLNNEQNSVDSFLEKKLKEKGLTFSQAADPITLLRRLQLVLTGILPTASEAQAFTQAWVNNPTEAYDAKVEELLASEHYGERWAQHWLDAIRWSETSGSESNLYRKYSWRYRDYVIDSFNNDKPYDHFIIDQLAGDQTGFPRATGFMVAGPHVPPATVGHEPSAIKEARYDRLDQVMQTVGASMMGMTLGCARCHSHKFDPIKIDDYYAILANFQGLEFGIRKPELSDNAPAVKNGKAIMKEISSIRQTQKKAWVEHWRDHLEVHLPQKEISGIRLKFSGETVSVDEIEIFDPKLVNIISEANISTNLYGPKAQIEKLSDGEIGAFYKFLGEIPDKEKAYLSFKFEHPVTLSHFTFSRDRKKQKNTDYEIRGEWEKSLPNFAVEIQTTDGKWQSIMKDTKEDKTINAIQALIEKHLKSSVQLEFIGRFINPVKTNVLLRGSPSSPGKEVAPNGLMAISKSLNMTSATSDKERRMKFAHWIASKENPLTARVMVNRLWYHVFGTGIVSTLSDFGKAGTLPSHPELLDYLATEFMEKHWSVKNMLRLLVHSKAFKQDNKPIEVGLKNDANARLLWRFPPRRAEAEVLRDSVLKFTDSLNTQVGGISYRIHNVKKRYALWDVVDNHSESTWRRMIYQERMRGIDDRMFTAFDFPDCGQVLSKRPSSTTPLQALNLMNSQFMITQCDILANKVHSSDKKESVNKLFQIVYNREPDAKEMAMSLKVLKSEGMHILCRALLNSNEFVFIQ